jgi:hypothetical protein
MNKNSSGIDGAVAIRVGYTRRRMARRLLAFALALLIIGGPLAADVCEAACTEHAGHSIDSTVPPSHHHHPAEVVEQPSHQHHSDVGAAPATKHPRLTALWHRCGHLEATVSESRELTRASLATAVVTVARVTPLLVLVLPTSQMDSRHGPPPPIHSTSPLRI